MKFSWIPEQLLAAPMSQASLHIKKTYAPTRGRLLAEGLEKIALSAGNK
jgi:hypothetical protein